ncbi:MAG: hypothetical protein Tsb0014_48120 [Pleurocapsa sp.]
MLTDLVWQQNSSNPNNAENLATIASWWSSLNGKEISWQQRLIPGSGDLGEIDWKPQKFDEKFVITKPQLRGLTVYWHHPQADMERNITARKLELNIADQKLDIYPESQTQVVICVSLPEIVYQQINLSNPQVAATNTEDGCLLLMRDRDRKLEIKVALDRQKITQILNSIKNNDQST